MKDALSEVSEKKALDAGTLFDWWNPRVLADFLGEDIDNLSMACGVELRMACSMRNYATRNAEILRAAVHIRDRASIAATPVASYGDGFFTKVCSGCGESVLFVQFQGLAEGFPQACDQFLVGGFLTIDSRQLFNPADPPCANLFHYRCVVGLHPYSLSMSRTMTDCPPESF